MNYNKDIMDWEQFPDYDLIWTDPPWEQKMVRFFETQLKKDTGQKVSHSIHEIIGKLADLADPKKPVVIEYSVKGFGLITSIMEQRGHRLIQQYELIQQNGMPFMLLVFNQAMPVATWAKGRAIITQTLKQTRLYKTVFDPFAGIGFTARGVRDAGLDYVGSELNFKRFKLLCNVNP